MIDGWLPWAVVAAAALVTYASRAVGVIAGGRIDPAGPAFAWISCVAYALLAGLVSRMIFLPLGPLADAPLGVRIAAVLAALAAFLLSGRNLLLGILAGLLTLSALTQIPV